MDLTLTMSMVKQLYLYFDDKADGFSSLEKLFRRAIIVFLAIDAIIISPLQIYPKGNNSKGEEWFHAR